MKYFIIICCLFFSRNLYAQQAKAYEIVHYTAKSGDRTFLLAYADGYIGASEIRLKQPKNRTVVLRPVSGVTETNGDFEFKAESAATQGQITLKHIDEMAVAPTIIEGVTSIKNHKIILYFRKAKR